MAEYDICWYETYSHSVVIEAEDEESAVAEWNRMRESGEISAVFGGGDLIDDEITDITEVK